MKKEYIKPEMEVEELELSNMIAMSHKIYDDEEVEEEDGLVKDRGNWGGLLW